jgi:hypothetical protein
MLEAFKGMADPEAIKAALYWTMTVYALLWMAPEPVSKFLAAGISVSLIGYLGWDTLWTLIGGWRRLVLEVDHATTFSEIREAGERYGKVMGQNAARAFALLLSAAIGQTAAGFSAKLPALPGSAQASVQTGAQAGIGLSAVAAVDTVVVTADAVTIALSPGAVTSTAHAMIGATAPVKGEGPWHHIATDKWSDATHSGGPWTPRFQELFDRAGMSLNDPANKVRVRGHRGPHPEEYHEEVYERLRRAVQDCRSILQCQEALKAELKELAREISTEGTLLNKLITRSG